MSPETDLARRSHALLTSVMDLDPEMRRAFVHKECAADPPLLKRVLELLDAADQSEQFLDRPALDIGPDQSRQIPDAVGDYLVVGVLGVGGMATVYEALQDHPRRRVALKVMHQTMTSPDAYLRFRFETEAMARLHHPGIAQIYEAGAAQLGQPVPAQFFAMELVPNAVSITVYADRHAQSLRERITMVASVCDAVHHGHQHGIIHRDLKPANVLIDGEGQAKVIDFGVARATTAGADSLTATVAVPQLIGTLNYMSPEQCGGRGEVDIRTDVYSLGVMLYELVCGCLPHDLADLPLPAALDAIVHKPPRRPELPRVHRDLEAIILKAIEKDPDRRYDSASALAADLRHFLGHRPTEARPPGVLDQCRLFARRNRTLVATGLAILVSVVLVAAISTGFAVRLADEVGLRRTAEQRATSERDLARWQAYTAQIAGALSAMHTGEFQQMRTRLAEGSHRPRGWEWGFLSRLAERSAGTVVAHDDMIMDMAVNAGWTRLVTAAGDGSIRLWDAKTGALIAAHESDSGARVFSVAFTTDGRRIVAGDQDGVVRLMDADDLRETEIIVRHPAEIRSVIGLPGERVAVAASDGSLRVWTLEPRAEVSPPADQPGGVLGVETSPDGALVATFNEQGSVWIRRAADLAVIQRLQFPGSVHQARFSADSRRIGAAGAGGHLFVWEVQDGKLVHQLKATPGVNTVRSLAFSNDGKLIAAGLGHRGIVVVSAADGRTVGELGGHTEAVCALSFRPDDQLLVSASWDRTIRTWLTSEIVSPGGMTTLQGHHDHVMATAFSPDGSVIASASRDGALRLWDPDLSRGVARLSAGGTPLASVAFSPDGRRIATGGAGSTLTLFDADTGSVAAELTGDDRGVASVTFDPSGQRLAAGGQDGTVRIWSLAATDEPLVLRGHTARVNSVAFSPDGALIASGSRDRGVRLWNAHTGAEIAFLTGHESDVFAVLFSHDGRRLYTGSRDQTVRVWDIPSGKRVAALAGHGQFVTCLALTSDGARLAAGSWFGEIVLFDVATLDLIASFRAHESAIRGIAFSPDGRWLASASYDATVQLFDSATREESDATRASALSDQAAALRLVSPLLDELRRNPATITKRLAEAGLNPATDPWIRKAILSALAPPEEP